MTKETRESSAGDISATTRRDFLAKVTMGLGLVLSYGVLGFQGLMFLLPKKRKAATRKLFVGKIDQISIGAVKEFTDLQGNKILIKRDVNEVYAFSSRCPHLGCKVHWEDKNSRFFCPCHNGVFSKEGVATEGPPAAAGQRLESVPLFIDERSGVIYWESKT